jgi:hypothetical protein
MEFIIKYIYYTVQSKKTITGPWTKNKIHGAKLNMLQHNLVTPGGRNICRIV